MPDTVATARSESGVGSAPTRWVARLAGSKVAMPEALANWPPPSTYSRPAGEAAAAASWIATGSRPAVCTDDPCSTEMVSVDDSGGIEPAERVGAASHRGHGRVLHRRG